MNKSKKSLLIVSLAAALGMGFANVASADMHHDGPQRVSVSVGWHGDRYWDGHRYWERREWQSRHHHEAPPPHRY